MTETQKKPNQILIIEDEGEMCLLLEMILHGKNNEIDHVKTVSSAKDYLAEHQPNLILLDNRLPDGLGVDFLPYLKSTYPDIKIIMISAKDGSAEDVALENGANIFLAKPFSKQQLFDSISRLLN